MTPRPRSTVLAGVLLLAVTALAGCSGDADTDDSSDSPGSTESDRTACRTIVLADASLAGARQAAIDGTNKAAAIAGYSQAISTVTAVVSDDDVSDEILDQAVKLIAAWSRTSAAAAGANRSIAGDPSVLISAEGRVLQDLESVCPGGDDDEDD